MDNASLAIGAGGSTVWERLCLGVDQVLISIARNQEYGCIELNKRDLATYLGDHEKISTEAIRFAIEQRIDARSFPNTRVMDGQLLVDGFGSYRVVEHVAPTLANGISIRRATTKEVALYFVWVNDQYVRSASFNDKEIRGRDWAKAMLDLALDEFRAYSQEAVLATVRNQNARSISALLKAGYAQISGDESSAVFLHT